jgi:hypothetical protein
MMQLRDDTERDLEEIERGGKLKPTCEFNSTELLQEYMRMNRPFNKTMQEKQSAPVISSQEYGWEKPDELKVPTTGRVSSYVTKFAAELIKAGVYF